MFADVQTLIEAGIDWRHITGGVAATRVAVCGERVTPTGEAEHEQLLQALLERLRAEGAPQGMWLIEIAQAREQLQSIDGLLRRLTSAIVESLGGPPSFG